MSLQITTTIIFLLTIAGCTSSGDTTLLGMLTPRQVAALSTAGYGLQAVEHTQDQTKKTNYDGSTLCGGSFVGQMTNGQWNGHGSHTWPDGRKYVGGWRDGKKNGQGTFTWPDGLKYVGDWCDDKTCGYGMYMWPDGRVAQCCRW